MRLERRKEKKELKYLGMNEIRCFNFVVLFLKEGQME